MHALVAAVWLKRTLCEHSTEQCPCTVPALGDLRLRLARGDCAGTTKGVVCGRVRVTTSLISLRRGQAAVRPHTRGGPPPDACRLGGASPAQGSLRSRTFPRRRWEVTVGQCLGDALDQNPYLDSSVPLAVVLAGIEHPAINSGLSPIAGPCGP